MKKIFFLFFSVLTLACQTKDASTSTLIPSVDEKQLLQDILPNSFLPTYFNEVELKTIYKIKEKFEFGLSGGKDIENIARLYEGHAQRMRLDLFNNFPYTLNFPYNGEFDLSQVDIPLAQLRFLNNNCGFQRQDGTKINFLCLSSPSNYTKFLGAIGEKNTLVASLLEDYTENKTITSKAKQIILLNSEEELDFTKTEHQIIYLFFHILVNEERLALEKLNAS